MANITQWPLTFENYKFLSRIVASDCIPKWKPEAEYLRFIHGFVQSAPQLLLQSIILLKGVHIHSLHDTIETVQVSLKSGEGLDSTISAISALTSDKPLRWYWGLIQVSTNINSWPVFSAFMIVFYLLISDLLLGILFSINSTNNDPIQRMVQKKTHSTQIDTRCSLLCRDNSLPSHGLVADFGLCWRPIWHDTSNWTSLNSGMKFV